MQKLLNIKAIRFILLTIFSWIPLLMTAQDIHISQFWLSPVAINPANAGFFDGDARIAAYDRNQWIPVPNAYHQTMGLSADLPLVKRISKQDLFGFGVMLDYDQAGDSKYTTVQGNLLFSYAHALDSRNNNFLMGGITLGGVQRSWDYSNLEFEDPNEIFYGNGYWFGDIGAGMQWFYQPGFLNFYQVGFSVYHINRPKNTMYKDENIRLSVRWVTSAVTSFEVRKDIAIIPAAYISIQDIYREFLLGATYAHTLPIDVKGFKNKALIGLFYRWNDAIYVTAGMEWRRLTFSISYDFNVSDLFVATNARGGVEIMASYIIKKKRYLKRKDIPCPIF